MVMGRPILIKPLLCKGILYSESVSVYTQNILCFILEQG